MSGCQCKHCACQLVTVQVGPSHRASDTEATELRVEEGVTPFTMEVRFTACASLLVIGSFALHAVRSATSRERKTKARSHKLECKLAGPGRDGAAGWPATDGTGHSCEKAR